MSSMVGGADQAVRSLAFAEPEARTWGAAWVPSGAPAMAILGRDDRADAVPLQLEGAGAEESWFLGGEGSDLELEGLTTPVWRDRDAPEGPFDQLCRVKGSFQVHGEARELDCLGWRGTRPATFDKSAGSFRLVCAWFDQEEGFALLAVRPRKAKGQDEDTIEAALFDPGTGHPVAEPRLSTTYTESGQPTRAGVELWMESEPESDHLYPRRAVGQALADPAQWRVGEMGLEAQPFRWFSGSREGPGVYLLGQW
jgi:hypothetical protein